MATKRKNSSLSGFVVCIDNSGYEASLERHKIYRCLSDSNAAKDRDLRVIDESGEDYLYEADRFVVIKLPLQLRRALSKEFSQKSLTAR